MGDAVLLLRLRRGQLVITPERHLVAADREDRVGAPLVFVRRAATRLRAAAPFVGEEHLRAVVVERRRMPEGEVRIGDSTDAPRVGDVVNVEQQAISRARAAGESDRRIDGDVVALCRSALRERRILLGTPPPAAARPRGRGARGIPRGEVRRHLTVLRRRGETVEDARRAHDVRQLRMGEGHLNHLDPEQRAVRILFWKRPRAARELVRRAHARRAGHVDVDIRGIVRIRDDRVRVRAAARLHRRHIPRMVGVAHIDDADAARALITHGVGYALHSTVDASVRRLSGHEQKAVIDRYVALRARADVRGLEPRPRWVRDVPHLPAAVVSLEHVIAHER